MFKHLAAAEKTRALLKTNVDYPAEIVQVMSEDIEKFRDSIGAFNFDYILSEVCKGVRVYGKADISRLTSMTNTGMVSVDSEYLASIQAIELLVLNARDTLGRDYFPYELTRTQTKTCLCYRKLNAMQMAEYAAELMYGNYSKPGYLDDDEFSDQRILQRLEETIGRAPYAVSY